MLRIQLKAPLVTSALCAGLVLAWAAPAQDLTAPGRAEILRQARGQMARRLEDNARVLEQAAPVAPDARMRQALQAGRQDLPQARAQGRSAVREAMAIQRALGPRAAGAGLQASPVVPAIEARRERPLEHLVIFVSSSIPEPSLTALFEQGRAADALLVFRGVRGETFGEMARWLEGLFEGKTPDRLPRMVIDPRLFTALGIEAVPAFALSETGFCTGPASACATLGADDAALVAGNVTLEYALGALVQGRPDLAPRAEAFLRRLEADRG